MQALSYALVTCGAAMGSRDRRRKGKESAPARVVVSMHGHVVRGA